MPMMLVERRRRWNVCFLKKYTKSHLNRKKPNIAR